MVSIYGRSCFGCGSYNVTREKCFTCGKKQKVCVSDRCKKFKNDDENELKKILYDKQLYHEEMKGEEFKDVLLEKQHEIDDLRYRINCRAIHFVRESNSNAEYINSRALGRYDYFKRRYFRC